MTMLGCLTAGMALGQVALHVSPRGDDASTGSEQAPLRTLQRARDLLRERDSAGGATVWIHEGTYYLPDGFALEAADSGREGAPIVFRAAEGDAVWLSGGDALDVSRFTPVTDPQTLSRLPAAARGPVRQFALSESQLQRLSPAWPDTWWLFRDPVTSLTEVFIDGERMPMARWPNEGYDTFGEIVNPAEEEGETPSFRYEGSRPQSWLGAVRSGLWLYGYWRRGYRAEFVRVKSIDPETRLIELAARHSLGPLEGGGASRYCAIHVLEELDRPGEWYLDRDRGVLLLWPPESASRVVLSLNGEGVIRCDGASHLEFRNLGVECSAGVGIRIDGGSNVRVVGCEVRNVGSQGIVVTGDRQQILGCDIHHTGDKAVAMDSGDRHTLTAGDSVIDNCHLHHTNRIVRAGSQAVSLQGVGNRFSHNLIHDTGYIAVRFSGNEHMLEYNRLFRTNVESSEGGVFYTGRDWTSRGSVIRYNFIHHVQDSQEGCGSSTRFVHLDDSAPEIEVYGNVCYRLGGGVSICGGAANDVHDNLFVECAWGVDIGPRGKDMFEPDGEGGFRVTGQRGWSSLAKRLQMYRWNEPPYSTRYPRLQEIFTKRPIAAPWFNVVTRNVMVQCGRGIVDHGMQPEWSTIEDNWEGEDPGFVEKDHTRLDFRLKEDAVVIREIGFQPGPLDRIGLYASELRRSWPVPLDLPAPDWKPRWMHLRDEARRSPGDLPVFRAMEMTGKIVVDGVVDPMEWTPGDATGRAPEIHDTVELVWTHDGAKAQRPSQAMIQTDEQALYVCFRNRIDPNAGVTDGHTWGQDDAVEIALAEIREGEVGPIMVLRGYADGVWESSPEAGASEAIAQRASQGVRYAAATAGDAMWCAEWRLPFESLGVNPSVRNPRLLFHLSVRKPAGDEWVMWHRKGGMTWEVQHAGYLWLAQFGDMAPDTSGRPSEGRVDIDSRGQPVLMTPLEGCDVATWAKPEGCYLSASMGDLSTERWQEMSFSFVPKQDGTVILKLMGAGVRLPGSDTFLPVWVYVDDVQISGAVLTNGDLEAPAQNGAPHGWRTDVRPALWIRDPALAASGDCCVKTSHNHRFAQELAVQAGRTVTVKLQLRGVPTDQ